jgi:hypothetical protein
VAIDPKFRRRDMTEEEYLDVVNELLKTASPIGAYCLAFAEVLRRKEKLVPPIELLEELVNCTTVAEGFKKYETCLEYIEMKD